MPGNPCGEHTVYLRDIARWEMAKEGKEYSRGSIAIDLDSPCGKLIYLSENKNVPVHCAVFSFQPDICGEYIYYQLSAAVRKFISENNGAKIKPENFRRLQLAMHGSTDTQRRIAETMGTDNTEDSTDNPANSDIGVHA